MFTPVSEQEWSCTSVLSCQMRIARLSPCQHCHKLYWMTSAAAINVVAMRVYYVRSPTAKHTECKDIANRGGDQRGAAFPVHNDTL